VVKQSPGSPQDNEMIQLAPGYSLSFSYNQVENKLFKISVR